MNFLRVGSFRKQARRSWYLMRPGHPFDSELCELVRMQDIMPTPIIATPIPQDIPKPIANALDDPETSLWLRDALLSGLCCNEKQVWLEARKLCRLLRTRLK